MKAFDENDYALAGPDVTGAAIRLGLGNTHLRMKLPHGETDDEKTYSMPDPDALLEAYDTAYRVHFSEKRALTDDQLAILFTLAGGYMGLTMYGLGQECCVGKLREIWRARRARAVGGK